MNHSEYAARFVQKFQELLNATEGDPNRIETQYHLNDGLRELVDTVSGIASKFEMDDMRNPSRISPSVNREFVAQWRIYEKQFAPLISFSFIRLDDHNEIKPLKRRDLLSPEQKWELADGNAEHFQGCAMRVLALAVEEYDLREVLHDNGQVEMDFDSGFEVFKHWLPGFGFNSRRSLRRHQLLKVVNFSHEATSQGGNAKTGVIGYLSEAQKAFILGADFGALILLRSTMENTLLKLYSSTLENDPAERCEACDQNLYDGLDTMIQGCTALPDTEKEALRKVKKRADNLVHAGDYKQVRKIVGDEKTYEIFMANSFERIRGLIERSPV